MLISVLDNFGFSPETRIPGYRPLHRECGLQLTSFGTPFNYSRFVYQLEGNTLSFEMTRYSRKTNTESSVNRIIVTGSPDEIDALVARRINRSEWWITMTGATRELLDRMPRTSAAILARELER